MKHVIILCAALMSIGIFNAEAKEKHLFIGCPSCKKVAGIHTGPSCQVY